MAFSARDKLAGSSDNEIGGLILQKRKNIGDKEEYSFKKPRVSLLGLDALAKEKKHQTEDNDKSKVKSVRQDFSKTDSTLYIHGSPRVSFGNTKFTRPKDRHYRYEVDHVDAEIDY